MQVNKKIVDGQVAVLYSPGFGAGWSTWNSCESFKEAMIFDSRIVDAVLAKDYDKAKEIAESLGDYVCVLGIRDIAVKWVPQGSQFVIHEYDGAESVEILGPQTGYVA